MKFSITLFVILVCGTKQIFSDNESVQAFKELKSKLSDGTYDKEISPKWGETTPVEVGVSLFVMDYKLMPKENKLYVDMYFRQKWVDPRLTNTHTNVNVYGAQSIMDKIWIPDTFFPSSSSVKTLKEPTPNSFVKIESNGTVFISFRLQNIIRCKNGTAFETYVCPIGMESYGFSMKDISYNWLKGQDSINFSQEPVDSNYKIMEKRAEIKTETLSSGIYSRLIATFTVNKRCKNCVENEIVDSTITTTNTTIAHG